jgi:hypothetical protein
MKYVSILLLVAAAAVVAEDEKRPGAEERLAALKWMAGTWSGEMWGGVFTAYYSTPEGGKILSYSSLVKDGKQALYEFEKFDAQKGDVVYIPFPGGKRAHPFLLKESSGTRAVFENPGKDWPTRIEFVRTDDKLAITLSNPFNAKAEQRTEVFNLKREK